MKALQIYLIILNPKKIFFGNEEKQFDQMITNDQKGFQTAISHGLTQGFIEKNST